MGFSLLFAAAGIAVTLALAIAAVAAGAFTVWAGAVAATFGSLIVVLAGWPFLALLVLFVVASVLATRYGFEQKRRAGVHEGTHGERGVSNVMAHILVPTGLVLTSWTAPGLLPTSTLTVLYTSALAFGASDTFASEFGVLAGTARSLLTGRPVAPGTNGGVSVLGEAWALAGATATAAIGYIVFRGLGTATPGVFVLVGVASTAGFAACQIDSVLGETLENRGYLTKGGTNFAAMVAAVVVAGAVLAAIGVVG